MEEFFFPDIIGAQTSKRLFDLRKLESETNNYLRGVMQTFAATLGCCPQDEIQLNEAGTGILIKRAPAPVEAVPDESEPELSTRAH